MARASGSYPECHRFESSRRYHRGAHGAPEPYGPLVKWLRHRPFTAVTWVRIPYGSPDGGLAQQVRAPASHAGGHWFESSSLHQKVPDFARNQELFCLWGEIVTRYFSVFPSTQTVTQDTKGPESTGQERRGYTRRSCPLFCLLHCLTDDIADGICGIPFHLLRGVGVGAEGKACVVVPQGTR